MTTKDMNDFRAVQLAMNSLGFTLAAETLSYRWRDYSASEKAEILRRWRIA